LSPSSSLSERTPLRLARLGYRCSMRCPVGDRA